MPRILLGILVALTAGSPAAAGVFGFSTNPDLDPFIIVHPPGYAGTGGNLVVRICSAQETRHAVLVAIDTWNALERTTQNCTDCRLWEEGSSGSSEPLAMETTTIHELGHCAMGLGHINWLDDAVETSYTNGTEIGFYTDGPDGIRGSSDDGVSPPAGARVAHWFRTADNDPFVIDSTTIDGSTYTRRKIDLPAGHSWPASGNRGVGLLLGHLDSQAVMYSGADVLTVYHSLTADDVNTVEFAMSGLDETASTGDDYSVQLEYVEDCADAEIEVKFESLGSTARGGCFADVESLAPPGEMDIHHKLIALGAPGFERIRVDINSDLDWSFEVFSDGFEDGTTGNWSQSVP